MFRYIAPVLRYAVKYKLGRATLEQMEYGVGKMTEGYLTELSRSKRVASVEQLVDDFWDRNYSRIKPWYQPESDDVILTASFQSGGGEACRRLGVRNLVASEVDVETMKVTYLNFSTDCIGRWLVSQQQLFDRYMVSPYVRTRETAATMALPKAKWEETRVLRERSWGEINTITKDDFKTNYARNWMFKNTDPLYWRPPAGESIADVAENRVHNLLTSLNRKSDAESVVMVSHGDLMLALMLTLEDLSDEEFMHRAASDEWKITNCTCFHYSRRDPATGRTHKRFCWEQTARPVFDDAEGRWAVKVDDWREFKRPVLSNGDLVDVVHAVDRHL